MIFQTSSLEKELEHKRKLLITVGVSPAIVPKDLQLLVKHIPVHINPLDAQQIRLFNGKGMLSDYL